MNNYRDYWELVDPIWEHVSIYDGEEVFLKQFGKITEKQKVLFATHWCQSEVCNGGFTQFFMNPTGALCPEAVIGFTNLKMPKIADAVQQAMLLFGADYPRDREKRVHVLYKLNPSLAKLGEDALDDFGDEFYEPFNNLDDKFYDLEPRSFNWNRYGHFE